LLLWSIFWKGLALWKAARRDQPLWYIVMLLVNTIGLLEIIYIFGFAPRQRDLASEGRPPDL
jgi:methionyl-tRNA synthetase